MSERVFSSKNRADFEDSWEITHHTHLFVKLGRLSKASFSIKVTEAKDICTSFRATTNELRSMDFDKISFDQKLSEKLANS